MRISEIKIPIYHYRFTMIESSDPVEMEKYFRKMKFKFDRNSIYAHAIDHYRIEKGEKAWCVYVIFNRKNEFKKLSHSAIAHECNHVADFIFESIGVTHYNDEPHCYLVEYLVGLVCEFLNIKNEIK